MGWWSSVASLTPLAVWDALHFADGRLLDQVGNNAIAVRGDVATPFPLHGLYGQHHPWPLTTPLSLSGDFVLMGFAMHAVKGVMFYKTLVDGSSYFMSHETNDLIYQYANNGGGKVGVAPGWKTPKFMALVVRPSGSRFYMNGNWAGDSFARSWVADSVGGIGYHADSNAYNMGDKDRFFAAGLWSGTANLVDLRTLETACRTALAGPPVGVRVAALNRLHSPCSRLWDRPGGYSHQYREMSQYGRNIYFGGNGQISGTVKEKGQPDQALVRQVLLYSDSSRVLVASTWSDEAGNYCFADLDLQQHYTVISVDYRQLYRAVIADRLKPEPMS